MSRACIGFAALLALAALEARGGELEGALLEEFRGGIVGALSLSELQRLGQERRVQLDVVVVGPATSAEGLAGLVDVLGVVDGLDNGGHVDVGFIVGDEGVRQESRGCDRPGEDDE